MGKGKERERKWWTAVERVGGEVVRKEGGKGGEGNVQIEL